MRLLTALSLTITALALAAASARPASALPASMAQQPQAAGQGRPSAADELAALNRRVRELYDAKKYEEAAKLAQTAVEEASRIYGAESAEVSAQLSGLAAIYLSRRDAGKAKRTLGRLLELREKRGGPSQKFEQDALEQFTCLVANDLGSAPDPALAARIERVFIEDSVLAQGFKLSADRGELRAGSAASKPPPRIPREPMASRTSGAAVMRVSIDEQGRVTEAVPLGCSSRAFVEAGVEAARRVTYNPTLVGGKPVRASTIIFYRWVFR